MWAEGTADCTREDLAKGVGTTPAFLPRATGNHKRVLYGDILLRRTLVAARTGGPSRVECTRKAMSSRHWLCEDGVNQAVRTGQIQGHFKLVA